MGTRNPAIRNLPQNYSVFGWIGDIVRNGFDIRTDFDFFVWREAMTTPSLLPIPAEASACRAAWKDMPVGTMAWHCHHEALSEVLTEPAENRIAYILSDKPKHEQALRLRLFRPAPTLAPAWAEYNRVQVPALAEYNRVNAPAWAEYNRVNAQAWAEYKRVEAAEHANCCPDCPWDGHTIFPVTP
jgi:hypothetical protein